MDLAAAMIRVLLFVRCATYVSVVLLEASCLLDRLCSDRAVSTEALARSLVAHQHGKGRIQQDSVHAVLSLPGPVATSGVCAVCAQYLSNWSGSS